MTPRRAVLLAAGRGTRLGSLSETTPKCLQRIAGVPLVEHTLRHLAGSGVTEIAVNLHHLPDAVVAHCGDGSAWGVAITYSYEPDLLGTAGTVRMLHDWLTEPFVVWYADNLSHCDLHRMGREHKRSGAVITVAAHERDETRYSGAISIDERARITSFAEKSPVPRGRGLVNAGIYLMEPEAVSLIPERTPCDFGADVFPAALEKGTALHAHVLTADEGLWWSDTESALRVTRTTFRPGDAGAAG